MGQRQTLLERQLSWAKEKLDHRTKVLGERGIDSDQCRRDPEWRSLNSRCQDLKSRLSAVADLASRNEDAAKRKQEKLAAQAQAAEPEKKEKAPKKEKKQKKKKE